MPQIAQTDSIKSLEARKRNLDATGLPLTSQEKEKLEDVAKGLEGWHWHQHYINLYPG